MSPRSPPKISLRHDWARGEVPLGSTLDQQPEGKVVRQSRGEVQHATFSQLTQQIPKPICDRSGQPDNTQDMFVVKDERKTSRSHEINAKGFHGELCSSDRSGQPDNLSENIRVEQIHDRSGQLDERNSSNAHIVKEQHAPEVHREVALLNTDNEFNREINEEDIDFNIPGLPHSTVKQLHGASVRELIQKIENHPHRHALQRDLQQSQPFNPFSQESEEMIHEVGNIELCELLDMEPKTQCKVCLSYWDIGIVYCTCGHFLRTGTEEKKKFIQYTMDPHFYSWLLNKERATSRAPLREEARRQRILHRHSAQEEVQKEVLPRYPRSICTRWQIPQEYDWNWSNRRSLSPNGWSCGRRSYLPFDSTRSWHLQK